MTGIKILIAEAFARLPEALHYKGEPTAWMRVTRPGQVLHSFLEGPCFDAEGQLWLVDVPCGRLFKVDGSGQMSLGFEYDGEPHGLGLMPDGRFAMTDYRRGLLAFDPRQQTVTTLCEQINTEAFRGLSDLTVATNGDVWFSDSGRSSLSNPYGRVFRLKAGAKEADLVLDGLSYPNGLALSPDGSLVYLAVTRANAVWRFLADWPDPGAPMCGIHLQLSGGLGPDGLAMHPQGYLATAHAQSGRVWVHNRLGDLIARIDTPDGLWTTAVTWSPSGDSLFIVEAQSGSIYRVPASDLF